MNHAPPHRQKALDATDQAAAAGWLATVTFWFLA
jgi:hypothetical protein